MLGSKNKYPALLLIIAVTTLITSSILWGMLEGGGVLFGIIYSVFFCTCGYLLAKSKRWLICYALLTVIGIACALFTDSVFLGLTRLICNSGCFLLLFVSVFTHSLLRKDIPHIDRIFAGIGGYLLLGLFWQMWFGVASAIDSDALMNQANNSPISLADQLYFSFVTLTTLGYGDIAPNSPLAKVITIFTSLSGVLYLAILIASLITPGRNQE